MLPGRGAQEDAHRRAVGRRRDHRLQVELLCLPHRAQFIAGTRFRTQSRSADFAAPAQRFFEALKDKPGRKIVWIISAGGGDRLASSAISRQASTALNFRLAATSWSRSPPTSAFLASKERPIVSSTSSRIRSMTGSTQNIRSASTRPPRVTA
jgi:hypothetical protein